MSLNVRPNKVVQAAKWLVINGNLYKEEGIAFNDTWLEGNSNILLTVNENDNDQLLEGPENIDCNAENMDCNADCKTGQIPDDEVTGVKMRHKYLLESLTLC